MKKIFSVLAFFVCLASYGAFASSSDYKLDEGQVDQLFAASDDVTSIAMDEVNALALQPVAVKGGGQTVGGYLLRSYFCGFIALHRKYMGGDWGKLWWKYFCIPVVGSVTNFVDFWWVVFMGRDAMDNYDGEDKFIVWLK